MDTQFVLDEVVRVCARAEDVQPFRDAYVLLCRFMETRERECRAYSRRIRTLAEDLLRRVRDAETAAALAAIT